MDPAGGGADRLLRPQGGANDMEEHVSYQGWFKAVSKSTGQVIPATGPVDGGTLLRVIDQAQNINSDRFILPTGVTAFQLQFQATFSSAISSRPTWVQIELCRVSGNGTVVKYDTTAKSREGIVQPGTTTWADVFDAKEFVNDNDGSFGWTVTHNGSAPITISLDTFIADNTFAQIIHKLMGQCVMSDGSVSPLAWK